MKVRYTPQIQIKTWGTFIMVRFEKDRYIIEVVTSCNPMEDWLMFYKELLGLMSHMDEQALIKPLHTCRLLKEMLPDLETAKKMVDE